MKRLLWLICLLCCASLATAQVPTTHAGKGSPGGGGGGGYAGPGDVTGWTTGVIAYWALRGFNAAYSGKVANICDASTGATCADATWSSAGSGTLTLPSIGGNPCDNSTHQCEVAILYDTSGALACGGPSSCDVSVAHGSRPTLVINCLGTKPCFTGSAARFFTGTNTLTTTVNQPFSQTVVGGRTTGGGTGYMAIADGSGGAVESLFGTGSGVITIFANSSLPNITGVTEGVVHTLNFVFDGSTSTSSQIQADSGASTGVNLGITATLTGGSTFAFPSTTNGTLGANGMLFEAGWWTGARTANFSNMHANQCAYWGTTC